MDAREQLLKASNKIGSAPQSWSHLLAAPYPPWLLKVTLRFARVFTPALKVEDLRERPELFSGSLAGIMVQFVKMVDGLDLSVIADDSPLAFLKTDLPKMRDSEFAAIQETLSAANQLPGEKHAEFFATFGAALENKTASDSLKRLFDSHTVQICLFLIFTRPRIVAGEFKSISDLVRTCIDTLRAMLGNQALGTVASRLAFERQFRKICSEDGLRLRGRGRPKKNTPGD